MKDKKILPSFILIVIMALFISIFLIKAFKDRSYIRSEYELGIELFESKQYESAKDHFIPLGNYEKSKDYVERINNWIKYNSAKTAYNNGDYENAAQLFSELGDFEDSKEMMIKSNLPLIAKVQEDIYSSAMQSYCDGDFFIAKETFESIKDVKDSEEWIKKCDLAIRRRKLASTLSAGIHHSLGVKEDGSVVAVGSNLSGQCDVEDWKDIISVSGFDVFSIGLTKDGTAVLAGSLPKDWYIETDISDWSDLVQIASGEHYLVGLKKDGTVLTTGFDSMGETKVSDWTDIVCVATGWRHTVGLKSDGSILIVGKNADKQLQEIAAESDKWKHIVAIAAGGGNNEKGVKIKGHGHTVGLCEDGTVVAVGDNEYGQCDVDGWSDIIAISAGDWHTVGLKSDGTVVATGWDGSDHFYQTQNACSVDEWRDIIAIDAGTGYTLGLKADGTVVSTGYDDSGQQSGTEGWTDIRNWQEYWYMDMAQF